MTGFLYYLPGRGRDVKLADAREIGLGYAFDRLTPRECMRGPDGGHGVIIVDPGCTPENKLGHFAGRQQWRKIPGCEAWVGCYIDVPQPGPSDLARSEQIPGEWLTLEDGNRWLIPMARRYVEADDALPWICNLPQRLTLDCNGEWTLGDVKAKYNRLWTLAMGYELAFATAVESGESATSDGVVRFSFDRIDDLAISALATNYRVGPAELDMLGIYDIESRQRIIDVVLDSKTWQAWCKKKLSQSAQDGVNSSSGPEQPITDSEPGITQPRPNGEPMPLDSITS